MSTFEATRSLYAQTHFTIIEIDLPVVNGTCTISGEPGFGTPLSCDQPSDGTKTYRFAEVDAPLLPGSEIYRIITSISETPTELKSGRGIASRASLNIGFTDTVNADPNPFAPGVTSIVKSQGTYMSKFFARNIVKNKPIRIMNYRLEADGSIDLVNGAEVRHYIIDSAKGKDFKWTISCKDELSRINIGESVWPIPLEGSVRTDVNDTSTAINVDENVIYQVGDALRIGEEIVKVTGVSNIGIPGSSQVTVATRGAPIVYTNTLTYTTREEHSATDEIFICEISDNEKIADLLERILLDVGIDASYIPKAEWNAELDEWLPTARINTLWIESKDTAEILESILTFYLVDMWFDPVAREVKLSAVNVWKQSGVTVTEGNQIDFESISKSSAEQLRATRALVIYDKRSLATSDSVENYKKASLYKRTELEATDLYGEPKTKRFEFSHILDKDSADSLVNRYVSRYIDPSFYSWKTQERKLTFNTGDIVNIDSSTEINFDGSNATTTRAQIISIKPNYTNFGRDYTVKALSYEPIFETNSEIILSGNFTDVNLFNQHAGTPAAAVTLTFVFDGSTFSSASQAVAAVKVGAFADGSVINIILANGADLQSKGGNGGAGENIQYEAEASRWIKTSKPGNGVNGGTVFDGTKSNITINIYLSGATPSAAYPIANGSIKAPSGGDGGFSADYVSGTGGDGGAGGNGRIIGYGGAAGGAFNEPNPTVFGATGSNGVSSGEALTNWGIDGVDNSASKGLKGRGVFDNGATVTLFGATATNYINGSGDHP